MSHSKVIDEIADKLFEEVFGTETNLYYNKFVHNDVLTKELTDVLYEFAKHPINIDEEFLDKFNSIGCTSFMILPTQDKPIKIAYDNDCINVTSKENMIQINKNISSNMSNLAALDCSHMSAEEFEEFCKELENDRL